MEVHTAVDLECQIKAVGSIALWSHLNGNRMWWGGRDRCLLLLEDRIARSSKEQVRSLTFRAISMVAQAYLQAEANMVAPQESKYPAITDLLAEVKPTTSPFLERVNFLEVWWLQASSIDQCKKVNHSPIEPLSTIKIVYLAEVILKIWHLKSLTVVHTRIKIKWEHSNKWVNSKMLRLIQKVINQRHRMEIKVRAMPNLLNNSNTKGNSIQIWHRECSINN